jgi:hypothetical protein
MIGCKDDDLQVGDEEINVNGYWVSNGNYWTIMKNKLVDRMCSMVK